MSDFNRYKQTKISMIDKGTLKRVLGIKDLFAIGYGDLGSSIYYALGITAVFALGATPLALLLAGLSFACTALTYAEMSTVVSEGGGSVTFTRQAFNDLVSFIAGWALLLDFVVTIAISAFSVGPYLQVFFPILGKTEVNVVFTIVLIFSLVVLNILGIKNSTRISWILTFLAVITQFIIIAAGLIFLVHWPTVIEHMKIGGIDTTWSASSSSFVKGVAMAMVAYTGIESMAQLSPEAKDPSKTVPRAIILAMVILIVAYMGLSVVALSAMTPQTLSTTYINDPVAGIVSGLPVVGQYLKHWVGLIGAILLVVAANAGLIGSSRLSFNLGEYYQLPRFFYRLNPKYKTPAVALTVFASVASLIIVWSRGNLSFLADLYNFGAQLAFFFAHIAIIIHRMKFKDIPRAFKIPLNIKIKNTQIPIPAILGAISSLGVWLLVIVSKPEGRNLGVGWLIFGLAMFFLYRKKKHMSPLGSLHIQKIAIDEYKNLQFKKILVPTRGGAETETVQIACQIAKSQGATLTAVNIIEIPFSMPLDNKTIQVPEHADMVLKRAEAIAREYDVHIELRQILARSVATTLIELVNRESFDLLVMGAASQKGKQYTGLGTITDKVLHEAPCQVWICRKQYTEAD